MTKLFPEKSVPVYFPMSKIWKFITPSSVFGAIIHEISTFFYMQNVLFLVFQLAFSTTTVAGPFACLYSFSFLMYANTVGPWWAFHVRSLGFVSVVIVRKVRVWKIPWVQGTAFGFITFHVTSRRPWPEQWPTHLESQVPGSSSHNSLVP